MEPEERAGDLQAVKERGWILISTPTPTQACRSPDQPCEMRKGYGEMDPGSLGAGKNWTLVFGKEEVTSRLKYRTCKP